MGEIYESPRIRVKDVAGLLGCSVSTVWSWVHQGYVPSPRKVGSRFSFWLRTEIEAIAKGQAIVGNELFTKER